MRAYFGVLPAASGGILIELISCSHPSRPPIKPMPRAVTVDLINVTEQRRYDEHSNVVIREDCTRAAYDGEGITC